MRKFLGLIIIAVICLAMAGIVWYMNNTSVISLNEVNNLTEEEITQKLVGVKKEKIITSWGEPVRSLFGLDADIYELVKDEKFIVLYYNGSNKVITVKIGYNEEKTEYTLEQLQSMSLDYYEMKNGYRPQNTGAVYDDENPDMVIIQLYDNLGDHNSNADWYTVNKYTAIGTNAVGNEIDLKGNNEE